MGSGITPALFYNPEYEQPESNTTLQLKIIRKQRALQYIRLKFCQKL